MAMAALRAKRFPRPRWPQGHKRLNPVVVPVALEWVESPYLFRGLAPQYDHEAQVVVAKGADHRATRTHQERWRCGR